MLAKHERMIKIAQRQEEIAEDCWKFCSKTEPLPWSFCPKGYTGLEQGLVSCMLEGVPYPDESEEKQGGCVIWE